MTARTHEQVVTDLQAWAEAVDKIMVDLIASQPDLHPITAHVIAGDILSARKATERVVAGEDPTKVYVTVGSFARWGWVTALVQSGAISREWFAENIADLWRGADPDDTDPANLAIWREAWFGNKRSVIRDGRPLPKKRGDGTIAVYRGGDPFSVRKGIAWTTDPKIARKFALGAGVRVPTANGVVIAGDVMPHYVLAYLTGRGESEVIVDPTSVQNIHPIGGAR